jgi:hypothetical protein
VNADAIARRPPGLRPRPTDAAVPVLKRR